RAFMTEAIGSLDWEDLRCVCQALDCGVTRVVGRAMDYQIARARRLRGAPGGRNMEPSRPRLGKAPAPGQDTDQGKATPEGGGAPCSGAGACCLCGRCFAIAGSRGPWKHRTVRRVSSAPARVRALVAERGIADKDAMLCRECRMDLLEGVPS
ncbi:MAG: hypothetical protein KBE65_15475, partial [Phycisphaerae bacterium]|nr:hypothetical protein [Phycisphaerae bacterium]